MVIETFESDKAALWNEDPQERVTSALAGTPGAQTPVSPQGMSNLQTTGDSRGSGSGRGHGRGSGSGRSRDRGKNQRGGGVVRGNLNADSDHGKSHVTRGRGGTRGRGTDGRSREEGDRGEATRGDKTGSSSRKAPAWAKPPPLVTVAQKDLSEEEAARAAIMKQFLKQPKADERFTAIGLYQWPRKSDVPAKIFGEQLKDLDKLRTGWRVYIDWNAARKCILIRATSPNGSEDVIEVMEGIRQAAESARAHSLTAAPLYIAVPPRSSAESTILLATVDTVPRSDGKKHLYDIKFSEKAADEQLSECYAKMKKMVETNEDKLHSELSTQLALNKLFKNKMRMRVNFGRLHLTHWQTELSDSRQTFAGFVKMMGKRTRIASVFEKELDAKVVATLVQKIKTKTTRFLPFDGKLAILSDVEPVHVVNFTVTTSSGKRYRIEADIDKVDGGYQSGCCRAFDIEERDPSLEIISIDIEKQVDWDLEIVRETVSDKMYPSFESLVKNCLDKDRMRHERLFKANSEESRDRMGLYYPQIFAHPEPGLVILDTSLRSTYRYLTTGAFYCVELVMNRQWTAMDTKSEPRMTSGVSVYHTNWDTDMESIEHTNYERAWPADMSNFFPEKTQHSRGGLAGLTQVLEYMREALSNPDSF